MRWLLLLCMFFSIDKANLNDLVFYGYLNECKKDLIDLHFKRLIMSLKADIMQNEGFSDEIYIDSLGFETIGYGFLVSSLTADELALNGGKVEPMSRKTAEKILDLKLEKLKSEVLANFGWISEKSENVQNVLLEMCYQMGVSKVKKFNTTLHHIRNDEYEKAYQNALKSLWAKQTPKRAEKVLSGLLG